MSIFKYLYIVLSIWINVASCQGQNFSYRDVPVDYLPARNQQYIDEVKQLKQSAVDLTKFLPSNHVTDGSVDYTSDLQKGINTNKIVIMPNFPVMVSGIHVNNGTTVIFQERSLLKMEPSKKIGYEVIAISHVHNVNLYFPKIKGDRAEHIGTKGEWGFGIGVISSKNIRILQPEISDCWGDGIYINNMGSDRNNALPDSNDIFVDGARIDNNRRNGISIIDGNSIIIKNSIVSNTNGTLPMSGIDVEPNDGYSQLKNIVLDSVITFNNSKYGILISLAFFTDIDKKDISLTIKNCSDDGSNNGMGFVFDWLNKKDFVNAKGNINVVNPFWKNSRSSNLKLPVYSSTNNVIIKFQNARTMKEGKIETFPFQSLIKDSKNIIFD